MVGYPLLDFTRLASIFGNSRRIDCHNYSHIQRELKNFRVERRCVSFHRKVHVQISYSILLYIRIETLDFVYL